MSCGFLATSVRDVLGDGSALGVRLRFVEEPEPRGTAGALKYAEDVARRALPDAQRRRAHRHRPVGADRRSTSAPAPGRRWRWCRVEDPSAYGLVRQNDDDSVREFVEKPTPDQIDTNLISAGAYVLEREIARAHAARSQRLDRARGLAAAGRRRALRLSATRPTGSTSASPTPTCRRLRHPRPGGRDVRSAPEGITVGAGCSIAADAEIGPLT